MRRFGFAKLMLWLGLLFIYLPMIIMVILISGLVELARPMPLVLITLTGALCVSVVE